MLATSRLVNGSSCDWSDMVIKYLDLERKIDTMDIVAEFCRPSWWKELSKETSSVGLDPQTKVRGMSIHFAPTGWCQIEEVWLLEATGEFSVKSVRQLINDSILLKEEVVTRWIKVMPIKINVFTWRVHLDKLPTRMNLSLKGIDILTIVCPLCHASVESGSHIFFSCLMDRHLWRKLMRWWELEHIDLASYDDWLL
ncbi:RNA-directed DNA polymerase, eukaryota [Tanacetum coccineum]